MIYVAFTKGVTNNMMVQENTVYARFMGDGKRNGYIRGLVYKTYVLEYKFSLWEKFLQKIYLGSAPAVEVFRILSTGIKKNKLIYMDAKEYDSDWRVERNKYFKNARKGTK